MIKQNNKPAPLPRFGTLYQVCCYGRVSLAEDTTGGHTLSTQQIRMTEYFDALYGVGLWQMTYIQDDGVSGALGTRITRANHKVRKGLVACAEFLDTKRFDAFAVYSLSRLGRDNIVVEEFLKEHVMATGTVFHSITENIDLNTNGGWLMVRTLSTVNTNQREANVERCTDAAAMRVQMGYYMGQVGYGWQWEPLAQTEPGQRRRILPIPEQAQWIKQMKDWYLAGWSPRRIAGELNSLGVPSPEFFKGRTAFHTGTEGSGKWLGDVVLRTLFQPTHSGQLLTKAGELVQGEFFEHRSFDPEVRAQMVAARETRKRFLTNTNKEGNVYLLNGLLLCGRCGKRLHPSTYSGGKFICFRCFNGHAHGKKTCPGVVAKEMYLDAAVVEQIERLAQDPKMREILEQEEEGLAAVQDTQAEAELVQLRQRQGELDGQFMNWADKLTRGIISEEQFAQFNGHLLAEKRLISEKLTLAEKAACQGQQRQARASQVQTLLTGFHGVWQHMNMPERREVLTHLVEKLTLDRDADGKTPMLTIKVLLLPEVTVPLMQAPPDRKRKFSVGVAALTPRHLAQLYWADQGKTQTETAYLMQVTADCLRRQLQLLRRHLGVHDIGECARKARSRIYAELATLPLEGLRGPQASGNGNLGLSAVLIDVLRLYASGAQTKDIAAILGLPVGTIAGRRHRILTTLHVTRIFDAVQIAKKAGII